MLFYLILFNTALFILNLKDVANIFFKVQWERFRQYQMVYLAH